MSTLRILLDQLVAPVPGGIGRYAENLTRELVRNAPSGWSVEGALPAVSRAEAARVEARLPELSDIKHLGLPRKALAEAWRRGAATSGPGAGADAVLAPSLFAPLSLRSQPTTVTVHDLVPWRHPGTLTPRGASWHRDMGARAAKRAAALTTPTNWVARELASELHLDELPHVVSGAPSPELVPLVREAAEEVADRHRLPEHFILAVGTLEPRKRLASLVRALARPDLEHTHLVVAGPEGWGETSLGEVALEAGITPARVQALGFISDTDLAALYRLADAFVMPSLDEGFGLPVVEAMKLGCPVVHSNAGALVEVAGGAGVVVELEDVAGGEPEEIYVARLAETIGNLIEDEARRAELAELGRARAAEFTWARSAQEMWKVILSTL